MTYNISIPEDFLKKYEQFNYPAGETQVRLIKSEISKIIDADEIRVTAREVQLNIAPLALLTDAIQELNSQPMTLILPYLPYSRADRRFVEGDCLGLKVFANQINALRYDQVVTLDVHSHWARKYVNNLVNVDPFPLVLEAISTIGVKHKDIIVLLPDEGAKERYNSLPCKVLNCRKKRDAKTGVLSGFEVPSYSELKDAHAIMIVDDICDGGGTFIGIAEALKQSQVECKLDKKFGYELYLYVTHGIFSKGLSLLSTTFEDIFTSQSFSRKDAYVYPQVKYLPIDKLIDKAIDELKVKPKPKQVKKLKKLTGLTGLTEWVHDPFKHLDMKSKKEVKTNAIADQGMQRGVK